MKRGRRGRGNLISHAGQRGVAGEEEEGRSARRSSPNRGKKGKAAKSQPQSWGCCFPRAVGDAHPRQSLA